MLDQPGQGLQQISTLLADLLMKRKQQEEAGAAMISAPMPQGQQAANMPDPEGADAHPLQKMQSANQGMGPSVVDIPGAELLQALGMEGMADPADLQEYDALPPEMKMQILDQMQGDPFFNMRDSLQPEDFAPFDEFDLNQMQNAGGIQVADAGAGIDPQIIEMLARMQQESPEQFEQIVNSLIGAPSRPGLAQIDTNVARAISTPSATQGAALIPDEDPSNPIGIREIQIPSERREAQDRQRIEQTRRMARTVTQDLGIFLEALDDVGALAGMNNPIGGFIQAGRSSLPRTPENRMRTFMESALANVGFNELQAMRENSPTGGALGNVTERQLEMLQSVLGRWKPTLSVEDQTFIAQRISNIYMEIIVGTPEERARAVEAGRMSLDEALSYDDLFYPETRDVMGRQTDQNQRQSVLDFLDEQPQRTAPAAQAQPSQDRRMRLNPETGKMDGGGTSRPSVSKMSRDDLLNVDVMSLSADELRELERRIQEFSQ